MYRRRQFLLLLIASAIALAFFFPIGWTAFTGLKTEIDALSIPPSIFVPLSLDNYWQALTGDYLHYLYNSIFIVTVSILVSFVLGLPAAYDLAFFPRAKNKDLLFFARSTKFMPGVAVVVPIFFLYSKFGWIDTPVGLIVIYIALNLPVVIWLMRSFFREVPFEIIESALIDGASHRRILWQIVFPLTIPGLATTTFLLIVLCWNEFFFAVNLTGRNAATLPVYIASFLTTEGQTWAKMSAGTILVVLPILVLGWVASRGMVRGLLKGAGK